MKKILLAALICAMTSLAGCDKLKHDITVNNVKFAFDTTVAGNAATTYQAVATRAGTDNTFTVTRTVNISEMGSSEIMEYKGKITNVIVNRSLLNITTNPAGSYSVADVTVTADGVTGSLLVPSYTLGDDFNPPANMITYTTALVKELIKAGTVSVTVAGKTDAPAGTTINISYESDLLLKASVL